MPEWLVIPVLLIGFGVFWWTAVIAPVDRFQRRLRRDAMGCWADHVIQWDADGRRGPFPPEPYWETKG